MNIVPPDKTSTLIVTTLGAFLIAFMASALNVALPQVGSEFAMDAVSLGWVATSYLLTSVVLVVPFGRVADIHGRKKIFMWGIIIFTVTSVLLALSNSGTMLIAWRFVQGVGGALVNSTFIAILTLAFPSGERGRALGINVAAVYFGFSVGPFLGGLLTHYLGWRSIFVMTVLLGLVILVLIFGKMKGDWVEAEGQRFDVIGSVMYGVMLVAIIYGFTHLPGMFGIVLIVVGIIALVAFVIWELRTASPVLEIKLFKRSRAFTFSCLAALINYGATYAVTFLMSLYLQYIKGFSPEGAGFILIAMPVMQVVFAPFAGRLSDRIEPRIVASAGMACSVVGLLLFVFLDGETAMVQIVAGLVLIGLGVAFFASPNSNAVMSYVEKQFYGIASATITTMRQLGMILSMGIVMLLFALYLQSAQVTPENHTEFLQSVDMSFILFAVLCLFGVLASLARGSGSSAEQSDS